MVFFEEVKGRFNEGSDYTVSYKERGGKTVYNIVSLELKRILFADELRRGINIIEGNCIVEIDIDGNEKKSYMVSRGNYDFPRVENSGLFFKPFVDSNVRIPTYDESGRLLTDPVEIQEEVERRRRGERKGVDWKKEWSQTQIGRIDDTDSSRIREITGNESSASQKDKGKKRNEGTNSLTQQQSKTKEDQSYNEWLKQGQAKGWFSILIVALGLGICFV